jgi:pyrrolysine biosynthesis protein PylD
MTRLTTKDLQAIGDDLQEYDDELISKTGKTLLGIACQTAAKQETKIKAALQNIKVGVTPISSGEGIIGGFAEAVARVVSHMGSRAFVTPDADVAGLAEAVERQADVLMLADDLCFIALNLDSREISDNAAATGRAFATGLDLMVGTVNANNVLLIGCGAVGRWAARQLGSLGARLAVYDVNPTASASLAEELFRSASGGIETVYDLETALKRHSFILDASPAADIIDSRHLTANTFISAPGMPLGLTPAAQKGIGNRLLHDPLQLGVATMLVEVVVE